MTKIEEDQRLARQRADRVESDSLNGHTGPVESDHNPLSRLRGAGVQGYRD